MAYVRKTIDVWVIQGNCGYGWNDECEESTRREGIEQLRCYRENVNYPIRLVKRRERIAD